MDTLGIYSTLTISGVNYLINNLGDTTSNNLSNFITDDKYLGIDEDKLLEHNTSISLEKSIRNDGSGKGLNNDMLLTYLNKLFNSKNAIDNDVYKNGVIFYNDKQYLKDSASVTNINKGFTNIINRLFDYDSSKYEFYIEQLMIALI